MKNYFFIGLIAVLYSFSAFSQVTIVPYPHPDGHITLEQLWRVNIINNSPQAQKIHLEAELEDAQSNLVCSATSPEFTLLRGNNRPNFNANLAQMHFGTTRSAGVLRGTGRLPYGNYIVCYRVLDGLTGNAVGQFCQEQTSKPFSPPELVFPFDGDEISTTFPILSWKPPFPPGAEPFEYTIRLAEIKDGQHPLEALERNNPLLNRRGIYRTSMPYPADAWKLERGKRYVWQVTAKAGEFELGATDVWTFKVEILEERSTSTPSAYRLLQSTPSGSYYPARGAIKFVYDNRYGAPGLHSGAPATQPVDSVFFSIYPAGEYDSPVSMTVNQTLLHGKNQTTIQLQGVTGINDGQDYVLVICDPNGKKHFLEFTYLNN